jgi:hypothetical protein
VAKTLEGRLYVRPLLSLGHTQAWRLLWKPPVSTDSWPH